MKNTATENRCEDSEQGGALSSLVMKSISNLTYPIQKPKANRVMTRYGDIFLNQDDSLARLVKKA